MGQHWKNAPVYYTVAQIRFNPILSLEDYLPQLQERLRRVGYPDYKQVRHIVLKLTTAVGKEGVSPTQEHNSNYIFSNMMGTAGFVLDQGSLSFQTTQYQDITQFTDELFKCLSIVHDLVNLDYSERVGLRYLDAVMPRDSEDLAKYIDSAVMALSTKLTQQTMHHTYTETMAVDENQNRVVARTVIRYGRVGFPPDLGQVGLRVNERFTIFEGVHAILDSDASFEGREAFDINGLRSRISQLKSLVSQAFKASITEFAETVWKGD